MTRSVIAVGLVLICVGCGSEEPSTAPANEGIPTAIDALECDGRTPYERSRVDYDDGLATVQENAEDAWSNAIDEYGTAFYAPHDGYRVERQDENRALLSYDVGDRSKVAVVVANGVRDWNDDEGWGVLAWAQCDPAEFPAAVSEKLGVGVWENGSGQRLPVRRVRSRQGPEHCSWEDITFLLIGPGDTRSDWYVRDAGGEFPDLLRGTFAADATLPEDATDTGWQRNGRELWLSHGKDAAYLVGVEDKHDVERWPAAKEPIMCA